MISLIDITEDNYLNACNLKVTEEQSMYVAIPMRILASAYAMRNRNAHVYGISNDENIVGILMVKDLTEEPACYALEQFLIDFRYQNKGFGKQALELIINILSQERKFDIIELCVKMEDKVAIKMYKNAGFVDTGYIDPETPDSYILRYTL